MSPAMLGPYKLLKKRLGQFDSYADLSHLALLEFFRSAQTFERGAAEFVKERAEHFRLSVRFNQLPTVDPYMAKQFVIPVFESFEFFLGELDKTLVHNDLPSMFSGMAKLSDKMSKIRDTFLAKERGKDLANWEVRHELVTYFRLIRNYAAHAANPKEIMGELRGSIERLDKERETLAKLYGHPGIPNDPNRLTFEDYRFCSMAVKEYAFHVSALAISLPDLTEFVIRITKPFGRYNTKPARARNAMIGHLKKIFRVDNRDAEMLLDLCAKC